MMKLFSGVLVVLVSSSVGCASSSELHLQREPQAQIDPLPGKSVEERLKFTLDARVKASFGFGYVAAIREAGKGSTLTVGKKTLEPVTALTSNDLTALGSISKLFTGILVHIAVVEGKLRMDTRLDEVLPELKGFSSGAITIRELGLHESGMPKGPPIDRDPENPFKEITEKKLIDALRGFARPALPVGSTKYPRNYSNWGYHTLGLVLKTVYHRSFSEILKNRILSPLKMSSSGINLKTRKKGKEIRKIIPGYDLNADLRAPWEHSDVAAASGGVESTAADMEKFLTALENPKAIPGAPKLAEAMLATFNSGIGWDSLQGQFPLWKNGSILSHSAILSFDPVGKKAVFLGTNSSVAADGAAQFAIGHSASDTDLSNALPGRTASDEEVQRLKGFYQCKMPIPEDTSIQSLNVEVFEVLGRMGVRFNIQTKKSRQTMGGMLVPFSKPDVWTFVNGFSGGAVRVLEQGIRAILTDLTVKPTFECDKLERAPEAYPALEK